MLGMREPEVYGSMNLKEIQDYTSSHFVEKKIDIEWYQSNIEGEIVQKIQEVAQRNDLKALIINPGGYTHTSVAIFDALKLLNIPIIEVHISNTHKREEFRQNKITTRASSSTLEGFGNKTYILAIQSQLLN